MNLDERVRALEESMGNFPSRQAPVTAPGSSAALFQTQTPPDTGYPQPTDSDNTYYGVKLTNMSFSEETGDQGIEVEPSNQTKTKDFILDLGTGYIPLGTVILCWKINGQWWTNSGGFSILQGTAPQDITPSMGVAFQSPQVAFQTARLACNNPFQICIPNGYPNVQVLPAQAGGLPTIIGPTSIVLPGTLNSDVTPGGTGLAMPKLGTGVSQVDYAAIGQITCTDWTGKGGLSGKNCFLTYNGQWLMFDPSPCA